LSIIDSNEIEEKHDTNNKSKESFYLRRSTLVSPSLNISKKYNSIEEKINIQNQKTPKNTNLTNEKEDISELKNQISYSFDKIKSIQEEVTEHPNKKNVFAKNIYNLKPFNQIINNTFAEIIFDSDPLNDTQDNSLNKSAKLLLKFKKSQNINKGIEDDKISSLYKEATYSNKNDGEYEENIKKLILL